VLGESGYGMVLGFKAKLDGSPNNHITFSNFSALIVGLMYLIKKLDY